MKQKFHVTGMTCNSCSGHVEKAVKNLKGVKEVVVNLLSNNMIVAYNEQLLREEEIVEAVVQAGYDASVAGKEKKERNDEIGEMKKKLLLSVSFLIPLLYLSMHSMFYEWFGFPIPSWMQTLFHGVPNAISFSFAQFVVLLPIFFVNQQYFKTGFKMLGKRTPNMDSLIALGSGAAVLYGMMAIFRIGYGLGHGDSVLVEKYMMDLYFESAGTILTLITLGKYLETKSKGRTSEAIKKLMNLTPKTANVIRNGEELQLQLEKVVVDDILIIRPGGGIPVDGIIIEGASSVDESAITGESIPVEKKVSDFVISGTINQMGSFKFRATKVGSDTTLAKIIELVEEASYSKAPISKLADQISGVFVPIVILIAIIAAVTWLFIGKDFEFALSIGISVLVISCPCALGLATPVAIMVGAGKGAEYGILIKSAESLEILSRVDTVVLDKTGTITEGKPRVWEVVPSDGWNHDRLLFIASSLEQNSEHPLAEAVIRRAEAENIKPVEVLDFISIPGKGVKGRIQGVMYLAGSLSFMKENRIDTTEFEVFGKRFVEEGKTPLYFADETREIGVLFAQDVIKQNSKKAISELEKMGLEVIMLTGDHKATTEAIRKELGISRAVAEVLPQDKEKEIRILQEAGRKVVMCGDGINDSPALTRADVGVAIGSGTDVAIESADIVLIKNDLLDLVTAIRLSKNVMGNIKTNLFWAFFYNTIGIPLAAGVFYDMLNWKLSPMFGALAMSMSSVCVVTNALRIRNFKSNFVMKKEEGRKMNKVIYVEGMECGHCKETVERTLKGVEGVLGATADLDKKNVVVELEKEVSVEALKAAVEAKGYKVSSIE